MTTCGWLRRKRVADLLSQRREFRVPLGVSGDDVTEERAGRRISEDDRVGGHVATAEVPRRIDDHLMWEHEVTRAVLDAHDHEALAAALHESESQAVDIGRPGRHGVASAFIALEVRGAWA